MIPARAGAKWMASVMPMLALFGCGDPKEDEAKAAWQSGKAPRKAVTFFASSSPSIFDQTKETNRFSLPDGLFESDVIGDESALELLVAAGLEFPERTRVRRGMLLHARECKCTRPITPPAPFDSTWDLPLCSWRPTTDQSRLSLVHAARGSSAVEGRVFRRQSG